jgi:hypothetical protein
LGSRRLFFMPATIKNREQKVPQKVVSICHSVGYLSPGIGPDDLTDLFSNNDFKPRRKPSLPREK